MFKTLEQVISRRNGLIRQLKACNADLSKRAKLRREEVALRGLIQDVTAFRYMVRNCEPAHYIVFLIFLSVYDPDQADPPETATHAPPFALWVRAHRREYHEILRSELDYVSGYLAELCVYVSAELLKNRSLLVYNIANLHRQVVGQALVDQGVCPPVIIGVSKDEHEFYRERCVELLTNFLARPEWCIAS